LERFRKIWTAGICNCLSWGCFEVIIAVVFTRLIDRENRVVLTRQSVQINLMTERVQSEERNWVWECSAMGSR
jgi:hypothetical protein